MTLNVEMLKRIRTRIRRNPERFNMSDWVSTPIANDDQWPVHYIQSSELTSMCGTTCCLAGEAIYLDAIDNGAHWKDAVDGVKRAAAHNNIESKASDLLGLPTIRNTRHTPLFFRGKWPNHYLSTDEGEAAGAAALLTDMINGTVKLDEVLDEVLPERFEWWNQFATNIKQEVGV